MASDAVPNRAPDIPSDLAALLSAGDADERERAWSRLVEQHTRLILHVARSFGRTRDDVMDRYAHVLERLAENDYRRLRTYVADGRGKFSTWLVVVTRRLCLDHHRARYGRPRGNPETTADRQDARRRLADAVAADIDVNALASSHPPPDRAVRARDLTERLEAALAELSARDRLLLSLRFEDDRPAREVAELLRLPTPFHVYRRLNALLARLRSALEERGVEGAEP